MLDPTRPFRPPARARRPAARRRRGRGTTLIEVVAALALAGMLVLLAGTTVGTWIPRYQQRNVAHALAEALQVARGEALRRNVRVDLCPSVDGATCDPAGRWHAGWLMFVDENGDGTRDPGEPVVRVDVPAMPRVTVSGNRPVSTYVSYTPWGHTRLASGALQMGTFTVCRTSLTEIQVVLANGGRPRIQETAIACP